LRHNTALSVTAPLGEQLLGLAKGDETEFEVGGMASQMRTALSSMVANTGSRSPGELLMT
jgi:hypothetical protein